MIFAVFQPNRFFATHAAYLEALGRAMREEYRAIVEAVDRRAPRRVRTRLARRSIPTGGPLQEDDLVTVTWTVHAVEDDRFEDGGERRRHRLRRLLAEAEAHDAAPTVADLAEALGASVRTVRRDLQALRAAGVAAVTRGTRSPVQSS